jgi:GTPase
VAYDVDLASKPEILALNNVDAIDDQTIAQLQQELGLAASCEVMTISAATRHHLDDLLNVSSG